MGNGDSLAKPRGAEPLSGKQGVEDLGPCNAVVLLEQEPGLLENPLLAGGLDVEQDVFDAQEAGNSVHGDVDPFSSLSMTP